MLRTGYRHGSVILGWTMVLGLWLAQPCRAEVGYAYSQDDPESLERWALAEQPGAVGAVAPVAPPRRPAVPGGATPARPGVGVEDLIRPEPSPRTISQPSLDSMLASASPVTRLASIPNMFGDSFGLGSEMFVTDTVSVPPPNGGYDEWEYGVVVDVPPAGGSGRVKIAENNKALPMDRVYFCYNHYANALEASAWGVWGPTYSIDRYTLGLEKTFLDGLWSVELRMPFGGGYHYDLWGVSGAGADVGNLAITLKRLLYLSRGLAVAAGLCLDTPTGGDTTGESVGSDFTLYNDAVYLAPWVGFLHTPCDRFFYQGFLQVDVATNGNRVDFDGSRLGRLSDQTLMYLDLEMGYWLYRNPNARMLNGLASILEFHYTTTLQDADTVSGFDGWQYVVFTNTLNRVDVTNMTVGVHAELGMTTLGVGGVFPLHDQYNRLFDAEVQVFLNRRF